MAWFNANPNPQYDVNWSDITTSPNVPMGTALGGSWGDMQALNRGNINPIGATTNNSGFGLNVPTFQLALGGLNALGNLWGSVRASKLAKDQFNFTKDFANTNLNNQIQSYNTALEDRARSRAVAENRSPESAQAYIDQNRLTR